MGAAMGDAADRLLAANQLLHAEAVYIELRNPKPLERRSLHGEPLDGQPPDSERSDGECSYAHDSERRRHAGESNFRPGLGIAQSMFVHSS